MFRGQQLLAAVHSMLDCAASYYQWMALGPRDIAEHSHNHAPSSAAFGLISCPACCVQVPKFAAKHYGVQMMRPSFGLSTL
jgi:hypothetical protein